MRCDTIPSAISGDCYLGTTDPNRYFHVYFHYCLGLFGINGYIYDFNARGVVYPSWFKFDDLSPGKPSFYNYASLQPCRGCLVSCFKHPDFIITQNQLTEFIRY